MKAPQTYNACRGLFGAGDYISREAFSLLMYRRDQVGAVIHRNIRPDVQRGVNVTVVCSSVFALYREHRNPVIFYERGGNIVLRT